MAVLFIFKCIVKCSVANIFKLHWNTTSLVLVILKNSVCKMHCCKYVRISLLLLQCFLCFNLLIMECIAANTLKCKKLLVVAVLFIFKSFWLFNSMHVLWLKATLHSSFLVWVVAFFAFNLFSFNLIQWCIFFLKKSPSMNYHFCLSLQSFKTAILTKWIELFLSNSMSKWLFIKIAFVIEQLLKPDFFSAAHTFFLHSMPLEELYFWALIYVGMSSLYISLGPSVPFFKVLGKLHVHCLSFLQKFSIFLSKLE